MEKRRMTEEERERVRLEIILSSEEIAAAKGSIPMTQELFDSIVDKTTGMDVDLFFIDFISRYYMFLAKCDDSLEEFLMEKDPEIHLEELMEQYEIRWAQMEEMICRLYGEEYL